MQNDFEGENVAGLPSLDQLEFSEAEVRFSPPQNDLPEAFYLPQPHDIADVDKEQHNGRTRFLNPAGIPQAADGARTPERDHVVEDWAAYIEQADQQARQLASLREATATFLRRFARFAHLREDVLLLRSRTKFEWKTCKEYRRFVSEAQGSFILEASDILASPLMPDGAPERLQNAHNQVLRDNEAQDDHAQRTQKLETELADTEYKMQQKEASLAMAAEEMVKLLNQLHLPGQSGSVTAVESEPPSPSLVPSSTDINPILQNYFDKAGNANVLRERLIDIEIDYHEQRVYRQFQAEHDQVPDISNDEFEASYAIRHAEAHQELTEAAQIAHRAKQVCLDDGLDPDSYRSAKVEEIFDPLADLVDPPVPPTPSHYDDGALEDGDTTRPQRSSGISQAIEIFTPENLTQRTSRTRDKSSTSPVAERVQKWIDEMYTAEPTQSPQNDGKLRRSISVSLPGIPVPKVRDNKLGSLETLLSQQGSESTMSPPTPITDGWVRPQLPNSWSSESKLFNMRGGRYPDPALLDELREFYSSSVTR